MNKNNKFIFIFLFILTRIFVFFFIYFPLRPGQPIWAGLDPASPARPLAQASGPAGQSVQLN